MKERIKFDFHGVMVTGTAIAYEGSEVGEYFLVRLDARCVEEGGSFYVFCPIVEAQPIELNDCKAGLDL